MNSVLLRQNSRDHVHISDELRHDTLELDGEEEELSV